MAKLSVGNPLLLHYLRVPKKLGEEVGWYQDFTSKIHCLTVPKSFVWESFTVELFSGTEKFWRRGGGVIKILRRKFTVSQCRKVSFGNPLLLNYFGVPKKFGEEGGIKILRQKVFV